MRGGSGVEGREELMAEDPLSSRIEEGEVGEAVVTEFSTSLSAVAAAEVVVSCKKVYKGHSIRKFVVCVL